MALIFLQIPEKD